jgi:hypothetical protein
MLEFGKWKKSVEIFEGPIRESFNPYDYDETEHVRMARIKGPWHPKMAAFLENSGVKGLVFSFQDEFRWENYDFLKDLVFLEHISIRYAPPDYDFGSMPIESLTGLRGIFAHGKTSFPIDLSLLPRLQSCRIEWQPKLDSVFDAKNLKRLQIYSLNCKRADRLANLKSLENLEICHSGIRSFAPITALTQLTCLSLEVCHSLENLDGIEALQNLRCLHLCETHKVTSLDCLAPLEKLEVLAVSDGREIESVAPLKDMKNLKALWIAGAKTTIIDGDLTPLTRLPNLAMLNLGNRRHYSHRVIKKWNWDNLDHPDQQLEPV